MHSFVVAREEDEYDDLEGQSNKSNDEASCNDVPNESQAASLGEDSTGVNPLLNYFCICVRVSFRECIKNESVHYFFVYPLQTNR